MQISKAENYNTAFCAYNVKLRRIKSKELMHYDAIKKIADENNLDIIIRKVPRSKYLQTKNCYIITAKQDIGSSSHSASGTNCIILGNNAQKVEISSKVYDSVIKSVKKLASKINDLTGTKPEFQV